MSVTQHGDCTGLHGAVNAKAACGWSTFSCIYLTLPCPLASYSCPLPTTIAAHITTATLVFPLWVHLPAEKGSCCCNLTPWSTPMGILVFPVPSIFSMKFLCLTAFHEVEERRRGEKTERRINRQIQLRPLQNIMDVEKRNEKLKKIQREKGKMALNLLLTVVVSNIFTLRERWDTQCF